MTETVVTDSSNTVVVQSNTAQVIVTGIMGPPGTNSLSGLLDVDLSEVSKGSVLVYAPQTQKWTSTKLLEEQTIECGQF